MTPEPDERYLVISSDCHAGLPNAEYREWLDPAHRETFDAHPAERTKMLELAQRGMLNAAFAEGGGGGGGRLPPPQVVAARPAVPRPGLRPGVGHVRRAGHAGARPLG